MGKKSNKVLRNTKATTYGDDSVIVSLRKELGVPAREKAVFRPKYSKKQPVYKYCDPLDFE